MGIDPTLVGGGREQIRILDAPAGGSIGIAADQQRLGITRAVAVSVERASDFVDVIARVAVAQKLPDRSLTARIGGRGIGLGNIEGDLVTFERVKNRFGQISKAQAPKDEALFNTETFGDLGRGAPSTSSRSRKARHSSAGFICKRSKFSARLISRPSLALDRI
jgi:hypothetical protein